MYLVIVGVLLLAGKMSGFGPMAGWSWWLVLAPFGGAILWWHFADTSGWTKRRQMNLMEERKRQRRQRSLAALGLDVGRDKRAHAVRAEVARRTAAAAAAAAPAAQPADVDGQRRSVDPTL